MVSNICLSVWFCGFCFFLRHSLSDVAQGGLEPPVGITPPHLAIQLSFFFFLLSPKLLSQFTDTLEFSEGIPASFPPTDLLAELGSRRQKSFLGGS